MKKLILITILALLVMGEPAYGITANKTGNEITVTYTEPTTNADDSALMDLEYTTIKYEDAGQTVIVRNVPATAINGGGNITEKFVVTSIPNTERTISVFATATDDNGNESIPSNKQDVDIDELAPASPQ